jgi:hypothetical protein
MAELLVHSRSRLGGHGVAASLVGILALILVALTLGMTHRPPDHAVVLTTSEDCRRAFDDWGCRAIVARAQAIHVNTAPSFGQRETCEFAFGAGSCTSLKSGIIELPFFAPLMVAIAVTPDRHDVLPLYFGPVAARDAETENGRALFYHGRLIGRLSQAKVGGTDTGLITDLAGESLTADFVRQQRGR